MVRASIDQLTTLKGCRLGPSTWRRIRQEEVNRFADLIGEHQWLHVDVERARRGPFGATVVQGFLTLGLVAAFNAELLQVAGTSMALNYGLNRVRFPHAVRVGDRVRAFVEVVEVEPVADGWLVTRAVTIAVEDAARPACVAETVTLFRRASGGDCTDVCDAESALSAPATRAGRA